jgi:hypothetical protein
MPEIRFIKLGEKGEWEKECIENNTIRLGYHSTPHKDCVRGDWDAVWKHWVKERNGNNAAASSDTRQIRDFYELKKDGIWITFYQRKMYWCNAEERVTQLPDDSRSRKVIGFWRCVDRKGNQLLIDNIDGRITKVQGFRGTICGVETPEYLLRKINGDMQPEIAASLNALKAVKGTISELIKGLWWGDFELLVELIFSRSGWQRVSVLGKQEKDIDIDLYSPLSGKRAFVQVKTSTSVDEIKRYYDLFTGYQKAGMFQEMFYVYHTGPDRNSCGISDPAVSLFDLEKITDLVIQTGLIDWVINKRS